MQIPAGEFLYGDDKRKEVIREPFAIQKYPMTNLQFKRFMDDQGYDTPAYWSAEGWAWRTGVYDTKADESYKDWLSKRPPEKRGEPYYWCDKKWNNPLAPVVGVTWFEAEACANWLSKQLNRLVRLPTEQEWERAARGAQGREYPWGDFFTGKNLNCAEFWGQDDKLDWDKWLGMETRKASSTTIVGQFSAGATPEGICDLSGNVWEWTNSWYEDKRSNHICCGGSFYDYHQHVCCAHRYPYPSGGIPRRSIPDGFGNGFGLRYVSPAL